MSDIASLVQLIIDCYEYVVSTTFLDDAGHFRYIRLAFCLAVLQFLGIYCYAI